MRLGIGTVGQPVSSGVLVSAVGSAATSLETVFRFGGSFVLQRGFRILRLVLTRCANSDSQCSFGTLGQSSGPLFTFLYRTINTSNQALERTATRRVSTFRMIKTVSVEAKLAIGGGRSAYSR